jgi:tetratricopeptide (TPR) repeat protein
MAHEAKQRGNDLFAKKDYKGACEAYSNALSHLNSLSDANNIVHSNETTHTNGINPLSSDEMKNLRCTLYSNRAACYLQMKDYTRCIEDCNEGLKENEGHEKILYRRAKAYMGSGRNELAYYDFQRLREINPHNNVINKDMELCRSLLLTPPHSNYASG